jgi:hypothetical protein
VEPSLSRKAELFPPLVLEGTLFGCFLEKLGKGSVPLLDNIALIIRAAQFEWRSVGRVRGRVSMAAAVGDGGVRG